MNLRLTDALPNAFKIAGMLGFIAQLVAFFAFPISSIYHREINQWVMLACSGLMGIPNPFSRAQPPSDGTNGGAKAAGS